MPAPRLEGLTVGLLTRPPSVGGPAAPANRAAEQYVERLERSAPASSRREIPEPPEDTWPLFNWEAAESHRATFPARAGEYGDNVRAKLEQAQAVTPERPSGRGSRCAVAGATGPPVDLYVSPVVGPSCRPVDCDELEVRLALSAFLRPFNVLGWAAIAIGDLQLVAPRDERVLAAGLAWEQRATGVMSCRRRAAAAASVDGRAEPRVRRVDRRSGRPRRAVARRARAARGPSRRPRSRPGRAGRRSRA